ncbi:Peptidase A1 [Macleaya cordata]|uniref:Peptidase A1 n=1 Tax=Macleaya cordata TaxID=56857 RepID=A0A200QTR6_MACCD|nr:Peptidase A1 [Macleaya cordata]
MDTGSDLVWFPCSPFECILCEGKYDTRISTKPPNISTVDFIPCSSPLCSKVHSSLPSSDLCTISNCPLESIEISECSNFACPPFYYAYADGSFTARLYRDNLSIPMSNPSLNLQNFTFGCANSALAEPIGVAGFGRGILSLPAQLAAFSPELGNRFSYCLISHSFDLDRIRKPSPLILGRYNEKQRELSNGETEFIYTPMLDNPKHPYFYCVGLEAIQIGEKRIGTPASLKRVDRKGNGGMVVDSGTTFTMLPSRFYEAVATEFGNRVGRVYERASDTEDQTGLRPCYYVDDSVDDKVVKIPKVVLHFVGNVSVVLPKKNYFFGFNGGNAKKEKRKVGCLMLMNGGDEAESSGPAATLGNYQQQGFEVVYDLEERKVGFSRKKCASLWDNLNRG